jgi:hypothetical protein
VGTIQVLKLKKSCQEQAKAALRSKHSRYDGQRGLGQALDLAQSTISNFFGCKEAIRQDNFEKICEALRLNPWEVGEGPNANHYIAHSKEAFILDRLQQPGALVRIVAPSGFGKSNLISKLLAASQNNRQTIHLNLGCFFGDDWMQGEEPSLADFLKTLVRETEFLMSDGSGKGIESIKKILVDRDGLFELLAPKQAYSIYIERLQHGGGRERPITLAISKLDRLLKYPQIAEEFFSLLRSFNERANDDSPGNTWRNLRMILAHATPHIQEFMPGDINNSPFNVGDVVELDELSAAECKEIFAQSDLALDTSAVAKLLEITTWIGGIPILLDVTIDKIRQVGIPAVTEAIDSGSISEILDLYRERLYCLRHSLERSQNLEVMVAVAQSDRPTPGIDFKTQCQLHRLGLVTFVELGCIQPRCRLYRDYFSQVNASL